MIKLPRRAVTFFFVPLIDVLILLFCIFLLLPFVSKDGEDGPSAEAEKAKDAEAKLAMAEAQVRALLEERGASADRLSVRVLEIEAETGRLFDYNRDVSPPKRTEIANQAEAQVLIDRHKQKAGGRSAYFLILRPRKESGFPSEVQLKEYQRWFRDVPHGFDNP